MLLSVASFSIFQMNDLENRKGCLHILTFILTFNLVIVKM